MQSNPTLKKNWESKGDPKEPHTLQHLAVDHITGVNTSRGFIQSYPATTPDQHPDAPS